MVLCAGTLEILQMNVAATVRPRPVANSTDLNTHLHHVQRDRACTSSFKQKSRQLVT